MTEVHVAHGQHVVNLLIDVTMKNLTYPATYLQSKIYLQNMCHQTIFTDLLKIAKMIPFFPNT